jgi:DNA-binding transcriptional LysR family regulator
MFDSLFQQQGLSIDRLKALVEVVSAGSISKAVSGDPIRQSLYSRQLKELESFFGVELTRRKGRGLVITDRGRQLAQLAREQLQSLHDFKQSCAERDQHFRIGAGDSLLHWLVVPALGDLESGSPHLTFSLHNLLIVSK